MNNKTQSKSKKFIAGGALVLGTVLSAACFPMMAVSSPVSAAVDTTDKTIYLLEAKDTENVGNTYTIRTAYFGKTALVPVGLSSYTDEDVTESTVTVTYLSTKKNIPVSRDTDANITEEVNAGNASEMTYGTFNVDYVGTYRVNYSITIAGKKYEMNFDVNGVRSEASIGFTDNDDIVLPKVYDLTYDKAKDDQGNLKNVNLPLPTVYDENEKEVEVKYYAKSEEVATADTDYVVVSAKDPNGAEVAVNHVSDKFYIEGSALSTTLGTYTVFYRYYTKAAGTTSAKAQCLETGTKEFDVKKDYYKDYVLTANVASDVSAFVTGIENKIPTVSASVKYTSTTGQTSTTTENFKYEVAVKYASGESSTYVDTEDQVVDGKFTPSKNGEYKLTYSITDFYGNTVQGNNTQTLKASDTKEPEVFLYDASDVKNYEDEDLTKAISSYVDASTSLKSKTLDSNVVIYAIGATDNVSKLENIKLTRVISNSSSATIKVNNEFNAYNLIFKYDYTKLNHVDLLGKALDGKTEAEAKEYLKANKFLRVVYSINDVDAEDKTAVENAGIVTDKTAANYDASALKAALVEKGYALIDATHTIAGTATGVNYTITYSAEDEAGKTKSLETYRLTVYQDESDFEITEEPTIEVSTNFQTSYTTSDVITFSAPVVSSTVDDRPTVVTTYQFLKADKTTPAADAVVLKDEYKIDLSTATADSAYVVIKVVATTDYGVSKTYEKLIQISNINDSVAPTIVSSSALSGTYFQGEVVELPTIVYSDDYVAIMNARVEVYNLDNTGKRVRQLNATSTLTPNTWTNKAVFSGEMVAEFAGDYEVLVIASDPANNIITSYYYFNATAVENNYVQVNISSAINGDGTATTGEKVVFDTPTVLYNLATGSNIYGLLEDNKTAKYFTIEQVSGPSGYTKTGETTYTFNKAGTYKFKYKVYCVVYDGVDLKLDNEEDGVYYQVGSDKYYARDMYEGLEAVDANKYNELIAAMVYESETYTLTVSKATETKTYEINFGEDGVYASSYAKDTVISLYSVGADADIDSEKSKITVSYSGPTSSVTSYTLKEFTDPGTRTIEYDANGNIKYKLSGNGTYTIKYQILDVDGNEYVVKNGNSSYTLRVGDTEKPVVKFDTGLLNDNYTLNDTITLDISKILLSDNGVGEGSSEADTEMRNKLLDTMTVKLERQDDNGNWITVDNIGDATENIYKYKLSTAGEYKLTVEVKDEVLWKGSNSATFTVSTESAPNKVSTSTIGTILIVISVLVLVGVIAYFVISRILMNKKAGKAGKKASKKEDKKKDNK